MLFFIFEEDVQYMREGALNANIAVSKYFVFIACKVLTCMYIFFFFYVVVESTPLKS